MLSFKVVIPARFASTRLPGKPLLDIGGKPMVIRVAEQAAKSGAQQILIATDHSPIIDAAKANGFDACMTRADHASGTDRIAEVSLQQGWSDETIVVNVQGDEPLIPPQLISAVAQHLHDHSDCAIATACHPIHDEEAMRNPNIVKAVLNKHGNALYFSRAPIPWPRDAYALNRPLPNEVGVLRHIGIYAYRAGFLKAYGQLAPAPIEQAESLEQLRALYHGYQIGVTVTPDAPPSGVDTEQDLLTARRIFESR
ncbi:MAG: 3-deoxy-manno-octulosonate cytidylyltransferase [Gammaproteobacteria bacterium]|nr:3-deoxy-manno-octulosonate cytidylyltransferase [Gammaproteobacteria bacterium]MBU1448130.1 3-deoxy-manno-octulosonate cytidylyltransferase [Gammaproteobacteria bacterium]MDD2928727.1 3-deoxy-manno-octulosonate cytidylyltransferase [Sideroxydans sp.]MDD5471135.1 3-deoxy-manno-octulosonate cytidylyltransferase [Sideroxydans sp.]